MPGESQSEHLLYFTNLHLLLITFNYLGPAGVSGPMPGESQSEHTAEVLRMLCFSGESRLSLKNGTKILMKNLKIGDEILTADPETFTIRYEKIEFFVHRDAKKFAKFFRISTEFENFLEITGNHGIFSSKNSEIQNFRLNFAQNLQIGQFLLIFDEKTKNFRPEKISNLTKIWKKGIFAPMTKSTTIFANEIFASCYIKTIDDRLNRHLTEKFLRFWKFFRWIFSIFINDFFDFNEKNHEIPWLFKFAGNNHANLLL